VDVPNVISRQEQILDYLKGRNLATVDDIVSAIGASPATIRRDLIKLDQQGAISRTHGGVTLNRFVPAQPTTPEKQFRNLAEKRAIAALACEMVKPNYSVVLDAGTTTLETARMLVGLPLRVFTSDLNIALLFASCPQIEVTLTGGVVDHNSQSCVGEHGGEFLRSIYPDIAFVSANCWSLDRGITTPTAEKASLKACLVANARQRVLVADSSKYGSYALYRALPLSALTTVITDTNLPAEIRHYLEQQAFELKLATGK